MNTRIDSTLVTLEMDNYDKHLHGKYSTKAPYAVAYITLDSDERYMPLENDLLVFVNIRLVDNLSPKLVFTVMDNNASDETGGYTGEYIDELLMQLADDIFYNEVEVL